MEKDFDGWNAQKKKVNNKTLVPYYNEREIWWCSMGLNIGSEQDGKGSSYQRPVIVLKSIDKRICITISLTTGTRPHRYRLDVGTIKGQYNQALLSQIKTTDTRRLIKKIGTIDTAVFDTIRKTVRDML